MSQDRRQAWFEAAWAQREERVYPEWFGTAAAFQTLAPGLFAALGVANPEPWWLTNGVCTFAPDDRRRTWRYVTSGLSNPWGADPDKVGPEDFSGLGMELVLETRDPAPWAVGVLGWLAAVQVLVATGHLQGQLVERWDRVPLGAPIDKGSGGGTSALQCLLIAEPEGEAYTYPSSFRLANGRVDLMLCVGITEREANFARAQGGRNLAKVLQHWEVFPITDPGRRDVL